MNCKCQAVEDIFSGRDELVLLFYDQKVAKDILDKIKKLGFECKLEDDTLKIKLQNPQTDVIKICQYMGWSRAEQEGVMAMLRNSAVPLCFADMKNVKPLSQLVAMLESCEITNIIRNKSFTFYFQPIVDVKSGEIYGYEALLRGVREDGSLIPPNQIFDTAKRGDMLFYLDRVARETALETASAKKIDKKLFINFVPTAIYNPEYCLSNTVRLAELLEFNPKNIVFEVVETEKVLDTQHLRKILDYYKNHGFVVALDDVGSGYSTLNMLSQLHPNIIKIDIDIIKGIDSDSFKQSIFGALAKVAKDHEITVLAEGVETKAEAEWVKENEANLAQGYFWGKPSAEPARTL
jgi:EAL domain-containing protein (putative c-di-GMP-specific phosphodiesterase class I)